MSDPNSSVVPMLAPDGTPGSVPSDQVPAAIQAGGKLGLRMISPDGVSGIVPMERAHDAIKAGGQLAPPRVPRPAAPEMQTSALGNLAPPSNMENVGTPESMAAHANTQSPDLGAGIAKGAGQTFHTAGAIASLPSRVVGGPFVPFKQPDSLQPKGEYEKLGMGAESLLEFITGDELLKSASMAEKLGIAAKIAKSAESHPFIAKLLSTGLSALRQGGVGGMQSLVHGESTGDAAKTAAITGGVGLGLGAVGDVADSLKPAVQEIAGEKIPVRASSNSPVAKSLENIADQKPLQEFATTKTQTGGRRAIANIAKDVTSTKLQRLPANVNTFGDAADALRAEAKPTFEKLDSLSAQDSEFQAMRNKLAGGKTAQPKTFSDLQKEERMAFRAGNFDAAEQARAQQEALLDKYKDHFDPAALSEARSLWRQSSDLDEVHTALTKTSVVGPTPIELRATGIPDAGYINGRGLAKALRTLNQKGVLQQAGLTDSHIQSLQDLSTLLEKSNAIPKLHPLVKALIVGLHIGTIGTDYLASKALSSVMTNEAATKTLVKGLKSGWGTAAIAKSIKAILAPANDPDQSPMSGSGSVQSSAMSGEDRGSL